MGRVWIVRSIIEWTLPLPTGCTNLLGRTARFLEFAEDKVDCLKNRVWGRKIRSLVLNKMATGCSLIQKERADSVKFSVKSTPSNWSLCAVVWRSATGSLQNECICFSSSKWMDWTRLTYGGWQTRLPWFSYWLWHVVDVGQVGRGLEYIQI